MRTRLTCDELLLRLVNFGRVLSNGIDVTTFCLDDIRAKASIFGSLVYPGAMDMLGYVALNEGGSMRLASCFSAGKTRLIITEAQPVRVCKLCASQMQRAAGDRPRQWVRDVLQEDQAGVWGCPDLSTCRAAGASEWEDG